MSNEVKPKKNDGTDLEWLAWYRRRVQNILLEPQTELLDKFGEIIQRLQTEVDRRHGISRSRIGN